MKPGLSYWDGCALAATEVGYKEEVVSRSSPVTSYAARIRTIRAHALRNPACERDAFGVFIQ